MSPFEQFMLWVIATMSLVQTVFLYFIMLYVSK